MAAAQSSTMNTILAVLGLGAGAIFLYEAFAPKTVTTKYGNKITLYTYRGVPYHNHEPALDRFEASIAQRHQLACDRVTGCTCQIASSPRTNSRTKGSLRSGCGQSSRRLVQS